MLPTAPRLTAFWRACAIRAMNPLSEKPTRVKLNRILRHICLVIVLSASVMLSAAAVSGQSAEDPAITHARQSTVFLMQTYQQGSTQVLSCVGSGTLISADGLILTNAHLVEAIGPCRGEQVIVALASGLNEAPVPTYLARIVQVNELLDLAVVQIASSMDGSAIDPRTLNMPFVTVGDPSTLLPGNTLTYVGFPDVGSTSTIAVPGPIAGITSEKSGSRSAWLRTAATLGGVMSGGGAYDHDGRLAGILTSAAGTDGVTPGPSCLSIQDNNRDGTINERDSCVPIGNPVTMIRPVNFALPLIEAAKDGLFLSHYVGLPETPLIDQPTIKRLFFSPQISDLGIPTKIVSALPGGSKSIYLFFDYQNMRPGTPYEIRVTANGVDVPQLSIGPLAWGGGRRGTWYVGAENLPLADGDYEFTILLNGLAVSTAKISVGTTVSEPTFSNLSFLPSGSQGPTGAAGILFPALTIQIIAQFGYENMPQGQDWTEVWYLDGSEIFRTTRIWDQLANGQLSVSATNLAGLPLGTYRLELLIGKRLAATGDITLAGNRGQQGLSAVFSNPRISTDKTRDGLPAGQSGSVMPLGITSLFGFIDWDFMPVGTQWTYRWFLDGRLVASSTQPWDAGGVGQNYWIGLTSSGPLPEGSYALEVLVQNVPMFSTKVAIGSGTRPVTGQGTSGGAVTVTGTVTDALTGEGIPGAMIIVLNVKLTSAQFTWNEADILSQAIADQRGHFALSKPLPSGAYYTVYVFAEGYTTMVEDFFTILSKQTSPVDISIMLNRP